METVAVVLTILLTMPVSYAMLDKAIRKIGIRSKVRS
jgi:multisubunit Na+/H+ antiporter MnhG subunit